MRSIRRRARGFTFAEIIATVLLMSMVLGATLQMLRMGLRSYKRTTTDVDMHTANAQGIRRVTESLRGAMSLSLTQSTDGLNYYLTYYLPVRNSTADPVTGEPELREPLLSDGQARTYRVSFPGNNLKNGTLTDPNGKVLVQGIFGKDPQSKSTQHSNAYSPFQLTTIGSLRAVTVYLVTQQDSPVVGKRYVRMKTTVVLRNSG